MQDMDAEIKKNNNLINNEEFFIETIKVTGWMINQHNL